MKEEIKTKGTKWGEYEVRQHIAALREKQKEEPAPAILRAQTNHLICELYLDGYTCQEIRKLLSVSVSAVYRVLKHNGIFKKSDSGFPKRLKDKAAGLYKQGHEVVEIAGILHISPASVYNILHRYDIPLHTEIAQKVNAKKMGKAIRMYQDGIPCLKIKAATGVCHDLLYVALHKRGIPLREKYKGKERREAEERAIHLYCNTDTYTQKIEEETGVPHSSLVGLLKKRNIPLRVPLKPSKSQIDKAVRMYQEDIPYLDIKAATGMNNSQLYNALHERGVPMRDGVSVKTKERIAAEEKAIDLYCNTDMYLKEIGEETGIPMASLTRLLKKRNVHLQRKSFIGEEQKEEADRKSVV